jgi:hypothetical protein
MMTKTKIQELRDIGRNFIRSMAKYRDLDSFDGQSEAMDLARAKVQKEYVGAAADEIYEGMMEQIARGERQ